MQIGEDLTGQERKFMLEMLYQRKAALRWEFEHVGTIRPEVAFPQKIRTVKYDAWQAPGFPIPKSLYGVVTEMLRERLKRGIIESYHEPYRNP